MPGQSNAPKRLHAWELTPSQAIEVQRKLRGRISTANRLPIVRHVAGVDVGFANGGAVTRAAVCVFEYDGLTPVETQVAERPTVFPYVPGLLSFRELPAVLEAFERLKTVPDLLLCDGQGVAHPRRLGIASHLGLLADIPSIGVGKSRLIGRHEPVPPEKGGWVPLHDHDEQIGCVVRTRTNVKPVYVSPGHRVDFETAVEWVLKTTTRYKLPEPIRAADHLASRKSRGKVKGKR